MLLRANTDKLLLHFYSDFHQLYRTLFDNFIIGERFAVIGVQYSRLIARLNEIFI